MKKWLAVGAISAGIFGATGFAFAQQTSLGEGVMDRQRPEYDAKGLPLGGFRLFPTFDFDSAYDSNVLRQTKAGDIVDSYFFKESATLSLNSQWSRHKLDIYGGVDSTQYADLSSENNFNWNAGAKGRIDIQRGIDVTFITTYAVKHEDRWSPNIDNYAAKPTQYADYYNDVTLEYHPYDFSVTLGGSFERLVYDPTPIKGSSTPMKNADRNEDLYKVNAKAAYEFSPGYAAFVRANLDYREFDAKLDRNNFNRNSHGYDIDGGFDLMLTHALQGELYVGYFNESFKAPLGGDAGLSFGAKLDWYPTELLTVHFNAMRSQIDTVVYQASTIDARQVSSSFDWEVLRNVIVQGNVGYTDEKFKDTTRADKIVNESLGVKYLLNRYFTANAKYQHENRSSSISGRQYEDNTGTISLVLHM
jgi:hypothetical protein